MGDYIFAKDTLPAIISAGVTAISIVMLYRSSTKDRRIKKAERMQAQLESFYYPFVLRMRQNSILRKVFQEKYGVKFRILTSMLNEEKKFNENDKVVLNKIIENDKELNRLILQNQTIFGDFLREDLARLSAHYTIFILACERKINGETKVYENYLHPNLVYGKIISEIERIEQEIAVPNYLLRRLTLLFKPNKPQKKLSKKYWDKLYSNCNYRNSSYDGWLDEYLSQIKKSNTIIDLGCGDGVNSLFLQKNGIEVTACDFSNYALDQLKKKNPEIKTLCFDMEKNIPFKSASADIIISDLSLHYFTLKKTKKIIKNIFRILNNDGMLLCRVNSIEEYHWADADKMIEHGFYFDGNNYKRYFTRDDIEHVFQPYNIIKISEETTHKYGESKSVWKIAVKKK